MTRGLTLLGLGAGMMYFLDPDQGRRRRALVRDQFVHALHELEDAVEVGWHDLRNRSYGLTAEAESLLGRDDATDEVVVARVRSKLGRFVSHPRAIEVSASGGHVTLSGPILANEVDDLLAAVGQVRGVTGVEDRLEVHQQPGDVPALQGDGLRPGEPPGLVPENWSPAARLLAGVAGGTLALCGTVRGGVTGLGLGLLGLGLLASGLTDNPVSGLLPTDGGRFGLTGGGTETGD